MPPLSVDLNRDRLHEIEVQDRLTVSEPFRIVLDNHGEAVHAHLHLDDALSRVARLDAGNHYVTAGQSLAVGVETADVDSPVTGRLRIVTGYGAEDAYVEVTVEPDEEETQPVEVDESLGKPQPQPQPQPRSGSSGSASASLDRSRSANAGPEADGGDLSPSSSAAVGVGAAALAVVLAVGLLVVVDNPVVWLVAGAIVGAAVVGVFFAFR